MPEPAIETSPVPSQAVVLLPESTVNIVWNFNKTPVSVELGFVSDPHVHSV